MTLARDELTAAQRAIALAPQTEKYRVLEREAIRSGASFGMGKSRISKAVDVLCRAGQANGLDTSNVERIVGRGLQGIATLVRPAAERGTHALVGVGTAAALQRRDFAPLKFVVQEVLPEGLTLLAGAPEIGKSWLALDIAIAVAAGRFCLGGQGVDQGEVLYLALEDGEAAAAPPPEVDACGGLAGVVSLCNRVAAGRGWRREDRSVVRRMLEAAFGGDRRARKVPPPLIGQKCLWARLRRLVTSSKLRDPTFDRDSRGAPYP